jgi:predicted permease
MSALMQDLRYGVRGFVRTPGFTLAALVSVALGIGANSSIFSVASALLLRPLPYEDADHLVILWNRSPGLGIAEDWFSTAQYFDIKTGHSGFEQLAIAIGANSNLTGDGEPERIGTIRASSNLLPMLGARAEQGRLFDTADDQPGAAGVVVLSHGTWMRRYGGDPRALGRSLTLNGQPYQIVGVLPVSFSLPREVMPTLGGAEDAEVLLPLPLDQNAAQTRNREDYNIIGKLKRGVSVAGAQAEMDLITARLRRDHPDFYPPNGGLTFGIFPLQEQVVGGARRSILILLASVGCVLLIACANVGNLVLSRALGRQKEIAVRAALGASRGRIVRQLFSESILLGLAGGVLGLMLSFWSIKVIHILGTRAVPRLREVSLNADVVLFTLVVSIASGILFGLAPALRVSRVGLHEHLKEIGRGLTDSGAVWGRGRNMRRLLVVSEVSLSVILLIAAGLLIRSFVHLQNVHPGFDPAGTLTLELTMSGRKYNDAQTVLQTYRQLWERLARLPGVTAAGGVSALPLSQMFAWGPIEVEGRVPPPGERFVNVDQRIVAGRYFEAMEIPLREGRLFNEQDTRSAPRVVIVDEFMARQIWPNDRPIGKRLRTGGIDANPNTPWMTVVGVVGRVRQYTLDSESRIAMYLPHTQFPTRALNLVVRSAVDPQSLTSAARKEIRELDLDLPVYGVRTMEQRVQESLAQRRFATMLLTLFAAIALGLAAVGIYGVMTYLVSQGTRELGIRLALGASSRSILMLVVRQGMTVAVVGLFIGLAGALALTRFMKSLLFDVKASDLLTFASIAALLTSVALLASYVPARRAARIDPIESLRRE